jgi:hypothetical protein
MRTYALAVAVAAIFAFPLTAFSQAVEVGPRGVELERLHHGRSAARADCRELRSTCLQNGQLGEQGQGNCQRYREMCGLD